MRILVIKLQMSCYQTFSSSYVINQIVRAKYLRHLASFWCLQA